MGSMTSGAVASPSGVAPVFGAAASAGRAIPFVGAGLSLVGTALSFKQAIDQQKKLRDARDQAKRAIEDMKKTTEVNRMEALSVPMEAYRLAARGGLTSAAMGLQAAGEGDPRGLGAAAGRIHAGNLLAQDEVRSDMEERMFDIEKLKAEEQKALDIRRQEIFSKEAQGAQLAQANAEALRNQAIGRGFEAFTSAATTAATIPDLYPDRSRAIDRMEGRAADMGAMGFDEWAQQGLTAKEMAELQGLSQMQQRATVLDKFGSGRDAASQYRGYLDYKRNY